MRRVGRTRSGPYISLLLPGHPNADAQGRILEHRAVASWLLGRPLRKGEIVHHRNGVQDDNRWQNLEVMTQAEHVKEHRLNDPLPTCRKGHPWLPETTYILRNGARTCRICVRANRAIWRAKQRSAA